MTDETTAASTRTAASLPERDLAGDGPRADGRSAQQTASGGAALGEAKDQVTVRMPAEGAYLSVLRTATAGLAARLDFTLDEIEDLRIAVDEACAMLLSQAVPGSQPGVRLHAR